MAVAKIYFGVVFCDRKGCLNEPDDQENTAESNHQNLEMILLFSRHLDLAYSSIWTGDGQKRKPGKWVKDEQRNGANRKFNGI